MGSVSPLRIPALYFSEKNLKSSCADRDDVLRALEEFGCFEAVYDKVTVELHEAIFGLMKDLFDLPMETKCKNTSSKPLYGHSAKPPQLPLHEAFGIDDATSFEAAQNFTSLMWDEGKSNANCEILHSYAMRISELEKMVKKMVFQSLSVEKYYESHVESVSYLLRLKKYYGPMTDKTILGFPSHTDKSFFTILHQINQVDGLEVQTKDGEWIRVNPSPSSFIVFVGDSFYAWSNGRVHCPQHRVMMSGNEDRYSIALFSFSSEIVQCPKELVDEGHPLLFKPFDQMDLLRFYATEEGQKAESTLKAYCDM
ncbi:2-oxoglutarate (2OG) and Fe(II)-dependent oxygenase superfamily protein [Actinidia rufa]|uniref:2-oxoglutarate (2OG) and Fe(II)-dependent oxygenase superfamily protein n=1 Tax=Actinidia rufa TaxID=165716 RepID=A0A7J0FC79_9ERIC|nr:2-oxoglutarate (2OG) and Fe(II)-dependent oxygenase superfamily protein [Actinidia rufa]